MLHPLVLAELLDEEIGIARDRLAGRFLAIERRGADVMVTFAAGDQTHTMVLHGRRYDADPFALSFIDGSGADLAGPSWPVGVLYDQHPVLNRPWACVRGTYEYFRHPSHYTESWDAIRQDVRLWYLVDQLLKKAGS